MDVRTSYFDGGARLLAAPRFDDARGSLVPLGFPLGDFMPVRSFLVTAPDGVTRGGHGHRRARQLLMATSGRIEVELRAAGMREAVSLEAADMVLMIEPGIWSAQTYFGAAPALLVFSDRPYEPDDYFDSPRATGAAA